MREQNTEEIFRFLHPGDNKKLLNMKGDELQDLMYYLNNHLLTLRETLGLKKDITFGMELEYEHVDNREGIIDALRRNHLDSSWDIKSDGSLGCNGGEISSPILKDCQNHWANLSKVCKILSRHASIDTKSGGHIHVGANIFEGDSQSLLNFLKIWSVYENIIFRFTYGNFLTPRESQKRYAPSMYKEFLDVVDDYDDMTVGINRVLNRVNNDKYQAVNFKHVNDFSEYGNYNTVEFRCPNGTLDPVIWQNNLNLFVKLIQYSKRDDFNNDLINERRKINEDFVESDNDFTKIYLRQALEFADLIFFNNADKIYFLRQYLKNYQCGDKEFERAKPFTKTFI